MYTVADTLPVDSLDSGSFLLAAPALSGKTDLLFDVAAEGLSTGDGLLFVTTNRDANSVVAGIEARLGHLPEPFCIIDCVSEEQGLPIALPDGRIEFVSSPADLTGIGIAISEYLGRLHQSQTNGTRVCFHSLSTLLMYSDVETVFRFMHVLTGRVASIGGLGIFAIDPSTHDEGTVNTFKQLFDGMIELRDDADGREIRLRGVPEGPERWFPLS